MTQELKRVKVWQSGENQPFLTMLCTEIVEGAEDLALTHDNIVIRLSDYAFIEVEPYSGQPIDREARIRLAFEWLTKMQLLGYKEVTIFPDEYILMIRPSDMRKARLYPDGKTWMSNPDTGEYELLVGEPT